MGEQAAVEAEMKSAEETSVPARSTKKLWADEDDDNIAEELEFQALKAAANAEIVDHPVHIKSEELNESESTIKKVANLSSMPVCFFTNIPVSELGSFGADCCR